MEVKILTNQPFTAYPTVFMIPLSLRVSTKSTDGAHHTREVTHAYLGKDAVVQSAVYSKLHNRCEVCVASEGGALTQLFPLKFEAGYGAFKGMKTLHVTLVEGPKKSHGRTRAARLRTADGKIHYITKERTLTTLRDCFLEWLRYNVTLDAASEAVSKIPDSKVRNRLDVWHDTGLSLYPRHMLLPTLVGRIAHVLFTERNPITMQSLCDIGFLPGLPEFDVPARVLRKYDTKVDYQFVGLVQKGGKPNHTMNLQTAKRVSRFTGESVSEQELLKTLSNFPCYRLGPLQLWAIGTATKVTKELK